MSVSLRRLALATILLLVTSVGASPQAGATAPSIVGTWRGDVIGFRSGEAFRRASVRLLITRADLGSVIGTMTWDVSESDPPGVTPCIERVLLAKRVDERTWILRIVRFHGTGCTLKEQSWTYTITWVDGRRLRVRASSSARQYVAWHYSGTLVRARQ